MREARVLFETSGPSWAVGRLFGIPIRLHWTLGFITVVWAVLSLRGVDWALWPLILASSVLVTGCILLHELGHALMARQLGYPTYSIELHAFGGLASVGGPRGFYPKNDMLISAAGPATNF